MPFIPSRFLPSHLSSSTVPTQNAAFTLRIDIESPPIIFYGNPDTSSGSLLSGLLTLNVKDPAEKSTSSSLNNLKPYKSAPTMRPVKSNSSVSSLHCHNVETTINCVAMILEQTIVYHKPFLPPSSTLSSCANCKKKVTQLAKWDILTHATSFPAGEQSYPFSHLLPGGLPSTCHLGSTGSTVIKYELIAIAKSSSHETKVILPLHISRSILRGPDRNSLRVFPPTEVTATATLPNVIYPKSSFPIELRLENIVGEKERWRMRKLTWRIEETTRVKATSCDSHKIKLKLTEEYAKRNQALRIKPTVTSSGYGSIATSVSYTDSPAITSSNNDTVPNVAAPISSNNEANISLGSAQTNAETQANSGVTPEQASNDLDAPASPPKKHAIYSEEVRDVGHGEIKSGWKSDFSGSGTINLVADITASTLSTGMTNHITSVSSNEPPLPDIGRGSTVCCDFEDPVLGIYVWHMLIVEIVVAEEVLTAASNYTPKSASVRSASRSRSAARDGDTSITPMRSASSSHQNESRLADISPAFANHPPKSATSNTDARSGDGFSPTGAARILKMNFKLAITERSGLGIAWDDEVPPTYDDVSALSPPSYLNSVDSSPQITGGSGIQSARAPGIIYGVGETPGVNPRTAQSNIDDMLDLEDNIQEFTL